MVCLVEVSHLAYVERGSIGWVNVRKGVEDWSTIN